MPARFMPQLSRPAVVLATFYAAHFFGFGILLPFFPIWLAGKGLGSVEIGLILSLQIAVRVMFTAPLTALADRRIAPRNLLLLCNLVAFAAYTLLAHADGGWVIAALVAISAIGLAPIVPLCDLMTLAAARANVGVDYGVTRLFGSAAFLAATLGGGALLGVFDPAFIVLALAMCAGTAALATRLPVPDDRSQSTLMMDSALALKRYSDRLSLRGCLICAVAATAAVQASHAVLYGFGALQWQAQGYGGVAIGVFWALAVLSEMVLFARLGRHVGSVRMGFLLIAAGAVLAAVRFALMAFEPPMWGIIALQILHGGSFGATHLGAMSLLAALAPVDARAAWQGRVAGAHAFAMASVTAASGPLYRAFGEMAYLVMVPVALTGLGLIILAWRVYPHSAGVDGKTRLPS